MAIATTSRNIAGDVPLTEEMRYSRRRIQWQPKKKDKTLPVVTAKGLPWGEKQRTVIKKVIEAKKNVKGCGNLIWWKKRTEIGKVKNLREGKAPSQKSPKWDPVHLSLPWGHRKDLKCCQTYLCLYMNIDKAFYPSSPISCGQEFCNLWSKNTAKNSVNVAVSQLNSNSKQKPTVNICSQLFATRRVRKSRMTRPRLDTYVPGRIMVWPVRKWGICTSFLGGRRSSVWTTLSLLLERDKHICFSIGKIWSMCLTIL